MQQRIGVGQQKPVVLAVQGAYLFVDVIEQLQFVEVLQREAATVYRAILLRAESFRILKQGYQAGFGKADNLVLARRCLGSPVPGVRQAVLQGGIQNILIRQPSVAQLAEIAAYAACTAFQVFGHKGMAFQLAFELVVEAFHLLQCIGLHFTQYVAIELYCFGRAQLEPQSFAAFYVAFVENVPSEAFYFVGHIPAFVIGNALVDVVQQPGQYRRRGGELFNHAVYGIAQHLGVVQFDVQVGAEFQFAGKVAHDRLEKRVDCLHAEAAVVVQHILQCHSGALAQLPVGKRGGFRLLCQIFFDTFQVGIRCGVFLPDAVELRQDALFHFRRSLVGKGHGKYLPVGAGIEHQKLDVFHCQCEGLARTG